MKKKLALAIAACLLLVCMAAVPASARYQAINYFTAEYGKDGSTVYCGSTVNVEPGYDYELELILQRSSGGGYTDYHPFPIIYGTGTGHPKAHEKSLSGVSNSYLYRTKVILTVLDSDGNEVEWDDNYSTN